MKPTNYNSRRNRTGFTLVEILVVLVIGSILAAVTMGGYSAMRDSNRRTSCQANMAQIYQAIRLYSSDYDGNAPYYDPTSASDKGIGLWALYGFSSTANSNQMADANIKPEKRYISNPKVFHCPNDIAGSDDQLYKDSANSIYNPPFLSYQPAQADYTPVQDTGSGNDLYGNPQYSYASVRTTDITKPDWQRQLFHLNGATIVDRPPTDNTVVLWCPFHRNSNGSGDDNVLFWDGTIQSIPVQEDVGGTTYTGWQRVPLNSGS